LRKERSIILYGCGEFGVFLAGGNCHDSVYLPHQDCFSTAQADFKNQQCSANNKPGSQPQVAPSISRPARAEGSEDDGLCCWNILHQLGSFLYPSAFKFLA